MKLIRTTQDNSILIDDGDFDLVSRHRWYLTNGHATTVVNGKTVYIQRLILGEPDGVVDHINKNKLDNQRRNLRVLSPSQMRMVDGPRRGGTSSFKGVSWSANRQRWVACITIAGENRQLGYYDNEVAAAQAYDDAARQHYGEIAYLNIPDGAPCR